MYELKVMCSFSAAHQLREFGGACEKLHGHNWKIEVYVKGARLKKDGTLIDFQNIKKATRECLERMDHGFLNELEPFRDLNPSSENIARHVFQQLSSKLNKDDLKVSKVTAWESENSCASYMEP